MSVEFLKFLEKDGLTKDTIKSYIWTVNHFISQYETFDQKNLLAYKGYLMSYFRPRTVNLRLHGLNKYLEFANKKNLKVRCIKVQPKNFIENVVSSADYRFLKARLKSEGQMEWFFVIWFLAATGARISELLQIKAEHIDVGYLDVYTKGGKVRRIYIPKTLRVEATKWLIRRTISSGYIFLNQDGERLSSRGVAQRLKFFAKKYDLNAKVIYPHSFRHRFAKNFLEKYNDICLLADLMGHESIETTRIYLRKTSLEQQRIVDTVVTW
ncbi:MAG: tyrosine-type recombinase/integrase [Prevotellaceae bacterium]|jgi:site-specific recombinase XerD|nr:tyrosine-type recombinase/integrase [Prevotellaceae bacterium]